MNNQILTIRNMALLIFLIVLTGACSNTKSNKMIGVWKVDNVDVRFDEQKVNPQTLEQVIATEKESILHFMDDSTMHIIMGETNQKAYWSMEEAILFYYFDGSPLNVYELGKLVDEKIETEPQTPVGSIRITYIKSE